MGTTKESDVMIDDNLEDGGGAGGWVFLVTVFVMFVLLVGVLVRAWMYIFS